MKTRAAIAFEAGKPLEIAEVDLEGPKAGEVLVEMKATGVCHTDAFTLSGDDPEGAFPAILGHEGAGVVMEIGPGVTSLKPGDHVIPLYTAECRVCERVPSMRVRMRGERARHGPSSEGGSGIATQATSPGAKSPNKQAKAPEKRRPSAWLKCPNGPVQI